MPDLPDTVYLVRRRGDADGSWSVVTGPEIQTYTERPVVWEVEELRRVQAPVPAETHTVQRDVLDFHRTLDLGEGKIPALRQCDLRAALIAEEAEETLEAITGYEAEVRIYTEHPSERGPSLVNAIDGLCDLLAVIYGAAVVFGIDLAPFWDEVHRTNMAKVGGKRRADGKQLKPDGWQPPDIAGLLAELYPEAVV